MKTTKKLGFIKMKKEVWTAGADPTECERVVVDANIFEIEMFAVFNTIAIQWKWRGGQWSEKSYFTENKIIDGIFLHLLYWIDPVGGDYGPELYGEV